MGFANASRVDARNSIFTEVAGDQIINNNNTVGAGQPTHTLIQTLEKLPYAGGASFHPQKVCLQNTRTAILNNMRSWIKSIDANQSAEIYLLTSVVGAGKSAIAHTVAQWCKDEGLLWSSFFFDREVSGRNESRMLFSTIAHDLADRNPDFGGQVADALDKKKGLVGASTAVHFDELILGPSRCLPADKPVVIIIDGLDEGCDEEVLTILGNGVPNLPGTFRILLTSRPMEDLDFHLKVKPHVRRLSIDIDEPTNLADAELYGRHRLQGVAKRKGLTENWPGSHLLTDFTSRAGGLFIWILILSEYLHNSTDPESVLRSLLSNHSLSDVSAQTRMDQMYSAILQRCNLDDQAFSEGYGLLMGAIMTARTPLSLSALQSLHRHDLSVPVKACLRPLASLLTSLDNEHTPVQILHLSLKEFLIYRAQSSPTSQRFFLKEKEHSQRLGYLCLMVLNEDLKKCEHAIGYLAHASELIDVPDIDEDVVSEELLYACSFWIDHVTEVEVPEARFTDALRNFVSNYLVSWVEVITLKGRLQNLAKLRKWLDTTYAGDDVIKGHICDPDVAATFYNVAKVLMRVDRREEALEAAREAVELRRLVFPKTRSIGLFRRIFRSTNRTKQPAKNYSTYNADLETSLRLLSRCLRDLGHREEALDTIKEAVELCRRLPKGRPVVYKSNLASSVDWLSQCLSDLGHREDALNAAKEAVKLYRQLVKDRSAVYSDLLGYSLWSFSRRLSNLEHREEALDTIKKIVERHRQQMNDRPTVYTSSLASSVDRLSQCLSNLDHREDALKEVVELCRQLVKDQPAEHSAPLASSLWTFSHCLSDLNRPEEALDAIKETVKLYRQLMKDRPAVYKSHLASSVDRLSERLSNLGHREDALDAAKEAVELYRQLVKDQPAVYNGDLASSLWTFSRCLSDLERREEALDAIKETVELYRQLMKDRPAVYTSSLASSVDRLSQRLSNLGHREDALNAANEAVELDRQLVKDRPAMYNVKLASSLWSFSRCLSDLDHREEALDVIREAVELRRQLMKDRPAVYKYDLASSVDRLSQCLSDLGHNEDALDAIKEAVELYRHLAKERPMVYTDDLATSLRSLSRCLSDLGHPAKALDSIKEGVKLHRQLAKDRPAVFNPDLASSLDRFSRCLSNLGYREDALKTIREAVVLHRQLAESRPIVYNANLSNSLNHFSTCLSDLGHHEEALDFAREATELHAVTD